MLPAGTEDGTAAVGDAAQFPKKINAESPNDPAIPL